MQNFRLYICYVWYELHDFPWNNFPGKYQFRKQADGSPLPNAREIQIKVFLDKQSQYMENEHNVLFMEWGQFIAHDITLLPGDTSGKLSSDLRTVIASRMTRDFRSIAFSDVF